MSADLKSMCKVLGLAYVHDTYEDIPYQTYHSTIQFLENLFQRELYPRETAKAERLIKK